MTVMFINYIYGNVELSWRRKGKSKAHQVEALKNGKKLKSLTFIMWPSTCDELQSNLAVQILILNYSHTLNSMVIDYYGTIINYRAMLLPF